MTWLLLFAFLFAEPTDLNKQAAHDAYATGQQALVENNLPLAKESFERAILFESGYAEAHLGLGITCFRQGDYKQALRRFKTSVVFDPQLIEGWDYLGRTQEALKNPHEAMKVYLNALFIDPQFSLHEARFHIKPPVIPKEERRLEDLQLLQEQKSLKSLRIYVSNDTPITDTIVLVRYLKALKEKGAHVLFEPGQELQELFRKGLDVEIVDWLTLSDQLKYDMRISLSALPLYFADEIPYPEGYLKADPITEDVPKEGHKVGIIWRFDAGDPQATEAITLQKVLALAPGDTLFLLQPPPRELPENVTPLGYQGQTFLEIAAMIAAMDEVIGVDSAEVRLAAAMGKKTTIVLPSPTQWLWLETGAKTVWFSSANLARELAS